MKRGTGLKVDPVRAAERRQKREARRQADGPRVEDLAREARRMARQTAQSVTEEDRDARRSWSAAAKRQGCAVCKAHSPSAVTRRDRGADMVVVEGHHVIAAAELKRWGLLAALYDLRNMLPLCRFHHARHELAYERIPRELLPPTAFEFADEIGARFVLEDDRVYPRQAA